MTELDGIDPSASPSGTGCVECLADGGWWFHLRRCASCGHIGCCDASPAQHASAHAEEAGHDMITSFEPGESWFYSYTTDKFYTGPPLAGPDARPEAQPVPGPDGLVPENWRELLH